MRLSSNRGKRSAGATGSIDTSGPQPSVIQPASGSSGSTAASWIRHLSRVPTTPMFCPMPSVTADCSRRSMQRGPAIALPSRTISTSSLTTGTPSPARAANRLLLPSSLSPSTPQTRRPIAKPPAWKLCHPCHRAAMAAVAARYGWASSSSDGGLGIVNTDVRDVR